MARIEISLSEYNGLLEKVEQLEQKVVDKNKVIEELSYKNHDLTDTLEFIINDVSWIERIFHWSEVIKIIKEVI